MYLHIMVNDGSNPKLFYDMSYEKMNMELNRWKKNYDVIAIDSAKRHDMIQGFNVYLKSKFKEIDLFDFTDYEESEEL